MTDATIGTTPGETGDDDVVVVSSDGQAVHLEDAATTLPVLSTDLAFDGMVWDVVADMVDMGGPGPSRREYLRHPGSVSVVAVDDDERVLLIRQYRHAVRLTLWELPAGLLDEPGEDAVSAAARELREEADVVADHYAVLIDYLASPGGSEEAQRVYLARGVRPVPAAERHVRIAEEAGIVTAWVPLDDAVRAVLTGRMHNVGACIGVLAAAASRARGWSTLRPADSPWPEHPAYRPGGPPPDG